VRRFLAISVLLTVQCALAQTIGNGAKVGAGVSVGLAPSSTVYLLTVTVSGGGMGTVTSSPTGINCGATCTANFPTGTNVTLTANASNGSTFAGWSNGCTGTGACVVSMTGAVAVTATFNLASGTQGLTVTLAGTGSGLVVSNPNGIACSGNTPPTNVCSVYFAQNTVVTLTQSAGSNSYFAGWGGACSGTGACSVTMSTAQAVTATFNLNSTTGLAFSPTSCSSACNVTVTYTPSANTSIFCTTDGTPAGPASTLYTAPISLPAHTTTPISCMAVNTGSAGGVVQNSQNTATGSSSTTWETVIFPDISCCKGSAFSTPGLKQGGGVTGTPTGLKFISKQTAPSLDGNTLHLELLTTSATDVSALWPGSGPWPASSATMMSENFWYLQGSANLSYRVESDMVLYDRSLAITAALDCYQDPSSGSPRWQYNGTGGDWHDFAFTFNKDCPYPTGFTSSAITSTSQTTFNTNAPVDANSTIVMGNCDAACENMYVTSTSNGGKSLVVKRAQNGTTARTWANGSVWSEWVHVEVFAVLNPGVTQSTCVSIKTGNPTECVYFGYIRINGTLYGSTLYGGTQWGTLNVQNAAGNTVTVPALSRPVEPGYSTKRCFNQFQLYSNNSGSTDGFIDLNNFTCGYGILAGPTTQTYTIP
jgi:hypothetical protein